MDNNPQCSVCGVRDWESVREYHYRKPDPTTGPGRLSHYLELRRRVVFDVWFPGADTVLLTSILCRRCGFMTYTPRPSAADIDAKYRFLQTTEKDIGGQKKGRQSRDRDQARARRVARTVARHTGIGRLEILDVGGGNGKILLPFIERGQSCWLVDYNVQPIEGVRKIADRLEDVPADRRFDLVISSHVLEHLAEPAEAVRSMAALLSDRGILYGEVPVGVWGGIGIEMDPVTHINFFTKPSFQWLLTAHGLEVVDIEERVGTYNKRIDVVAAVARKGTRPVTTGREGVGVAEARRLLYPSALMKAARVWRLRRFGELIGR